MRKSRNLPGQRKHFFGFQAEFCLLLGHVYFEKNGHHNVMFCRFLLDGLRQPEAVHGVDHFYLVHDIFDFISLQMPDHVPVYVRRHFSVLVHDLLYFVFAEDAFAEIVRFHEHGNRFCLAYGDERDIGRVSADRRCRLGNLFSDFPQVICYHL